MTRRRKLIAFSLLGLVLVGVLGHLASAGTTRRQQLVNVDVNGLVYCWPAAVTSAQQAAGYAGVRQPQTPLVYVYASPRIGSFWMKDTPAPLVGVWVSPAGKVIGSWNGRPGSMAEHVSPGVVSVVIEYPQHWPRPRLGAHVTVLGACKL